MEIKSEVPVIGASMGLERYHMEVVRPSMQAIMSQLAMLASKVTELEGKEKTVHVVVELPKGLCIASPLESEE